MKIHKAIVLTLLLTTTVRAEEVEPVVWAHLTGENYGKVDTNIVVTAEQQNIFHFHSDFEGGGTWYDAHISMEGRIVTILERDSISTPCKGGSKVETKESIYRLSIDKIAGEPIKLRNGNRISLKVDETNKTVAAQSSKEPDIVHLKAGGETTLNGIAVEVAQLSEKFKQSTVIISADKSVPHKTVTAVLKEAAEAGITNVSFVTAAP